MRYGGLQEDELGKKKWRLEVGQQNRVSASPTELPLWGINDPNLLNFGKQHNTRVWWISAILAPIWSAWSASNSSQYWGLRRIMGIWELRDMPCILVFYYLMMWRVWWTIGMDIWVDAMRVLLLLYNYFVLSTICAHVCYPIIAHCSLSYSAVFRFPFLDPLILNEISYPLSPARL